MREIIAAHMMVTIKVNSRYDGAIACLPLTANYAFHHKSSPVLDVGNGMPYLGLISGGTCIPS